MSTMRGGVLQEGHEGGEGQQFGIGRRAGTATMGRPGEEAQDTGGERNQDVRREREHRIAGSISRQPLAVSDKWSNAQARMTMDQQSKVFDTDDDLKENGSGTASKASTCGLNFGHPHDNVLGEIRRTTEQEEEERLSDPKTSKDTGGDQAIKGKRNYLRWRLPD